MSGGDPKILWLDTETFSSVPITRGHHAYFRSPDAEVMVLVWAVDDGPVYTEDLTEDPEISSAFRRAVRDADEIVIHNSAFDRLALRTCLGIDIPVHRIHDTMARAMAHSLPGGLDKLCDIMGVSDADAKHAEGKTLIRLFCTPRPKNMKLRRATRLTHPEEWDRFLDYAASDITAMRSLYYKLPRWNYRNTNEHQELNLWRLDQKINDRGFAVDVALAENAISTIAREQKRLAKETSDLTNGEVEKATKRDQLLRHIFVEYGVYLPDLKKDTLERVLQDPELPDALAQLIRVRLATTTSSTAKFKSLLGSVSEDGRLRGTLAFCGAIRTGRWSGRIFQPHNLPRPDMKPHEIVAAIASLQANSLDLVTTEIMRSLSNILRGLIIAAPGRKIVAADLKQIESRGGSWLAGEQWKLDTIAEYDTGEGFDNYVWAFANAFGVSPEAVMADKEANGWWRQVGKVMELAQGYEGGVGAWLAFAMVYRLDLNMMAEEAYPRLPYAAREQAEIMWQWRLDKGIGTFGLDRKVFVVIEAFKSLWRKAHPAFSSYWPEMDAAAKEAVRFPGYEIECRKIAFEKKGNWLRMILPSGRVLCYPSPKVNVVKGREQLTYLGVNQFNRKWARQSTYGGKLFENATQAVARDVMAYNMPEIEDAGFPILLTVHDEVITEPEENGHGRFTSSDLSDLLSQNPPWLKGCPLAASGFEDSRYKKD